MRTLSLVNKPQLSALCRCFSACTKAACLVSVSQCVPQSRLRCVCVSVHTPKQTTLCLCLNATRKAVWLVSMPLSVPQSILPCVCASVRTPKQSRHGQASAPNLHQQQQQQQQHTIQHPRGPGSCPQWATTEAGGCERASSGGHCLSSAHRTQQVIGNSLMLMHYCTPAWLNACRVSPLSLYRLVFSMLLALAEVQMKSGRHQEGDTIVVKRPTSPCSEPSATRYM